MRGRAVKRRRCHRSTAAHAEPPRVSRKRHGRQRYRAQSRKRCARPGRELPNIPPSRRRRRKPLAAATAGVMNRRGSRRARYVACGRAGGCGRPRSQRLPTRVLLRQPQRKSSPSFPRGNAARWRRTSPVTRWPGCGAGRSRPETRHRHHMETWTQDPPTRQMHHRNTTKARLAPPPAVGGANRKCPAAESGTTRDA